MVKATAKKKAGGNQRRHPSKKVGVRGARTYVVATSPPTSAGGLVQRRQRITGYRPHAIGAQDVLSAFSTRTLALPRPIADHTEVRTIQNYSLTTSATQQLWVFVPFESSEGGGSLSRPSMRSYCGFKKTDTSLSAVPNGLDILNMSFLSGGNADSVECVPSKMTVRITVPSPLQTATGQFFLGRWAVNPDPRQYVTYADMADGFISYAHPRPLTAARLAVEGVEVSALPRDMNKMADFLPMFASGGGSELVQGTYPFTDSKYPWEGLTPIFFVSQPNSGSPNTEVNIQVAISWRWRFRMDNVASSTHRHHPPGSMAQWNKIIGDNSGRNGVVKVGNTGGDTGGS